MRKRIILFLLLMLAIVPLSVKADSGYRMELVAEDEKHKPGDIITVDYGLTYAMQGVGISFDSVESIIFFDINVLEPVASDSITDGIEVREKWILKSSSYNGFVGSYKNLFQAENDKAIIGASDIKNGIAKIATYTFKVNDNATNQTTKIYAVDGDGYVTSVEIEIFSGNNSSNSEDNKENNSADNKNENTQGNDTVTDEEITNTNMNDTNITENNNNFMNYVIVALLSLIMIILVILICVMISTNKKRNY